MNDHNEPLPAPSESASKKVKSTKVNPTGDWLLLELDQWDADAGEMEEAGVITFEKEGSGEMVFGCVQAGLDWRFDAVTGRIEFSFSGFEEEDEILGRGWAMIKGRQMEGRIFMHMGDESGFTAEKGQSHGRRQTGM